MRILHVIQEMRTGGAERVVVSLARGADANGNVVAVASAGGELLDELDLPRFRLPLLQRRPTLVPRAAAAVNGAIRAWSPTFVHCHNPAIGLVTALATLRGRRVPAAVSVHGVPEQDWSATARLLRLSGLPVVACGPGVAAALAEHGAQVLTTIVNGISAPPPAADPRALKDELGVPAEHRIVLAVGRLAEVKNHALAVRALGDVPDATLIIAGEGPERPKLAGLAASLGVEERLRLPGLRSDARAWMAAADVVVFTSRAEGLPLAALEGLASGTPVVAGSVRGLRELLTHDENALLVPADDTEALASALRRVLDDSRLAARLGAAGRRIADDYTEERMVKEYLGLYERLAR